MPLKVCIAKGSGIRLCANAKAVQHDQKNAFFHNGLSISPGRTPEQYYFIILIISKKPLRCKRKQPCAVLSVFAFCSSFPCQTAHRKPRHIVKVFCNPRLGQMPYQKLVFKQKFLLLSCTGMIIIIGGRVLGFSALPYKPTRCTESFCSHWSYTAACRDAVPDIGKRELTEVYCMRKTKIICTLGPSTDKEGVLRDLIANGMNVARFNFSHGSHEEHLGRLEKLKALREELGKPVAALLDTKGPEIRLKDFKNGVENLVAGQTFTLTTRDVEGTNEICSITYKDLPMDVEPNGTIMLDDGLIKLQIQTVNDTDIVCTVLNSGKIKNKKGVNVPGVHLSMPYMSQRDNDGGAGHTVFQCWQYRATKGVAALYQAILFGTVGFHSIRDAVQRF